MYLFRLSGDIDYRQSQFFWIYAFPVPPVNRSQMYRLGVPALPTRWNKMARTWNAVRYITVISAAFSESRGLWLPGRSRGGSETKSTRSLGTCCRMNLELCVIMRDSVIKQPTKSPGWRRTSRRRWTGRRLPSGAETRGRWKKKMHIEQREKITGVFGCWRANSIKKTWGRCGVVWEHGKKKDQGMEGDLREDRELNPLSDRSDDVG